MIEVFEMIHGDKVNLGKLFCIDKDGRRSDLELGLYIWTTSEDCWVL